VREWFTKWPDANVAILTGSGSGIVAVDIDGQAGEDALVELCGNPPTVCNVTGKGRHVIFQHPGVAVPNRVRLADSLDVRGDGGYIVVPPSIHALGHAYRWDDEHDMGLNLSPAPLPPKLLEALTTSRRRQDPTKNEASGLPAVIEEGFRNDTLTRYAGRLLHDGLDAQQVLEICLTTNEARCQTLLSEKEVRRIVASVAAREKAKRSRSGETRRSSERRQPKLQSIALSEVEGEQVAWLWPGYVPFGKITVLDGDPGVGKSTLTLDLAARVSAGRPMPDGVTGAQGRALILTAEDGLSDTVRPRLEAAGANLQNVIAIRDLVFEAEPDKRLPVFPDDVLFLQNTVADKGARLLIIDPLMAYLSGRTNVWNDHHVRRALAPLADLADTTGVAVVVVRHLNKKLGQTAVHRGGGSIAIIGAARSGLLVAKDPKDAECRVLAVIKSNVGRLPKSLRFHFEDTPSGVARIVWDGDSHLSAEDLVADKPERKSPLEKAKGFLRDALADGPRPQTELEEEAGRIGITSRTLRRAKEALRVKSQRQGTPGTGGHWEWLFPDGDSPDGNPPPQDAPPPDGAGVSEKEHLAIFGGEARVPAPNGPPSPKVANAHIRPRTEGAEDRGAPVSEAAGGKSGASPGKGEPPPEASPEAGSADDKAQKIQEDLAERVGIKEDSGIPRPDAERQAVKEHQAAAGRRAPEVLRRRRGRPAKTKDEA
jgi:hypothetical protein